MIETTAYLDVTTRKKLGDVANAREVTRSSLIVSLMRRVMKEHGQRVRSGRTVQYQARQPRGNRRCVHLSLTGRDYECFVDTRLFFRQSVSLLIAYAVSRYLDDVLADCEKNGECYYTDNNMFINHFFSCENLNDCVCWKIYWGIPEKLLL